jgi:hypothetical protein
LGLDKWNPPNPHRVESDSLHLPNTYNSTHRQRLGSSRTRKLGGKYKQRNLERGQEKIFLIASLLDPRTKALSFCDSATNTSPHRANATSGHGFLGMESKSFYSEIQDTQVDVLEWPFRWQYIHARDVDIDSVETELNAYTRVQQVPLDTDPLMWWNQHVEE